MMKKVYDENEEIHREKIFTIFIKYMYQHLKKGRDLFDVVLLYNIFSTII